MTCKIPLPLPFHVSEGWEATGICYCIRNARAGQELVGQSLELLGHAQDEQGQQNALSSDNLLLSSSLRLPEAGSQLLYWQCRAKKHTLKCD